MAVRKITFNGKDHVKRVLSFVDKSIVGDNFFHWPMHTEIELQNRPLVFYALEPL